MRKPASTTTFYIPDTVFKTANRVPTNNCKDTYSLLEHTQAEISLHCRSVMRFASLTPKQCEEITHMHAAKKGRMTESAHSQLITATSKYKARPVGYAVTQSFMHTL